MENNEYFDVLMKYNRRATILHNRMRSFKQKNVFLLHYCLPQESNSVLILFNTSHFLENKVFVSCGLLVTCQSDCFLHLSLQLYALSFLNEEEVY